MKPLKILIAVIAALLIAAGIALYTADATGTKADPQACKAAMVQQFKDAMATGAEGKRPAECAGLSDDQLTEIASQVMEEQLGASVTEN